jgi:hypothetical protein
MYVQIRMGRWVDDVAIIVELATDSWVFWADEFESDPHRSLEAIVLVCIIAGPQCHSQLHVCLQFFLSKAVYSR